MLMNQFWMKAIQLKGQYNMKYSIPLFIKALLITILFIMSMVILTLLATEGIYIVFGGFGLLVFFTILMAICIDTHD